MRKDRAKKRVLLPDPIYNDVISKFINFLLRDGKKNAAVAASFHEALAHVQAKRMS